MRQKVLEEQKLVPVPVTIANRTGGSGVVGKSYPINRPADGYTLVVVDASQSRTLRHWEPDDDPQRVGAGAA